MTDKNNFSDFDYEPIEEEELGIGLKILSFCIPIAGIIIYFSKRDTEQRKAKQACTMAWWGFALGLILKIIQVVFVR